MNPMGIFGSIKRRLLLIVTCVLISGFISGASAQTPAGPPKEQGHFCQSDLVELVKLDPTIKLDIRYATTNNFVGKAVYPEARAFLQRPAAEALVKVHNKLKEHGYGVLVFDAYRPWSITKLFWDITPQDKKIFVANPATGSVHNRGCAVDLSLYDLKTGQEIEMPSAYDEMSERAFVTYAGGTEDQRAYRNLLRKTMEREGFFVLPEEWWHFDFKDYREYTIQDIPFSGISLKVKARKTAPGVTASHESVK